MPSRNQILNSKNQGEPALPEIYRTRMSDISSTVRPVAPKIDSGAYRDKADMAQFLIDINKTLAPIIEEKRGKRLKAKGLKQALLKEKPKREKATLATLEGWSNALMHGYVDESEAPFFIEGFQEGQAKLAVEQYSQNIFLEWDNWKDKNIEDKSGVKFTEFLESIDTAATETLDNLKLPDNIVAEHYMPMMMGVRRNVLQQNVAHQQKLFRNRAFNIKSGEFSQLLNSVGDNLWQEFLRDHGNKSFAQIVQEQRNGSTTALGKATHLVESLKDLTGSKKTITQKLKIIESDEFKVYSEEFRKELKHTVVSENYKSKVTKYYNQIIEAPHRKPPVLKVAKPRITSNMLGAQLGSSSDRGLMSAYKHHITKRKDSISKLYIEYKLEGKNISSDERKTIFKTQDWEDWRKNFMDLNELENETLDEGMQYIIPGTLQ